MGKGDPLGTVQVTPNLTIITNVLCANDYPSNSPRLCERNGLPNLRQKTRYRID